VLDKKTGLIQLVNFGMGSLLTHEDELLQIQPGSPLYFSPDIIAAQPYLGKPTDMWSMGVVFYGLLFSEFPFHGCNLPSLYKKIGAMSYSFPVNKEASPRSLRVLKGIFKRNPSERLTCEQVMDELLTAFPDTSSSLQVVPSTEDEKETKNKKVAKAPEVTWVMPMSYDRNGEIRLKYSEVMRYHQHMFSKQNPTITAVS
jgi:serine/threonine protein kinase